MGGPTTNAAKGKISPFIDTKNNESISDSRQNEKQQLIGSGNAEYITSPKFTPTSQDGEKKDANGKLKELEDLGISDPKGEDKDKSCFKGCLEKVLPCFFKDKDFGEKLTLHHSLITTKKKFKPWK